MSAAVALLLYGVIAAAPPTLTASQPVTAMDVAAAEPDRTPMRCKPAPYYVADQAADRPKIERQWVTGSRVPLTARDYPDRRTRPCFLMRDTAPPNPLRTAD